MIRKALSLFVSVMIVLMSVSFAVSINAKEVFAEEITGCCVLDDSGNYCVDESVEGSCSGSFYSGISCSAIERESANIPSPCERVTCLEDDGSCSAQKYYKQCRDHSNSGFFEVPLSEVNECQEGCCQLLSEGEVVNQYSVSFLGQCTIDAASLGLTSNLLSECESLPEQIGCCVSNFGCDMTSNADCSGLDWFGEEMCSDRPTLCGDCGDYVNKECYQGDVYLANSCGEYDDNPISDCNVNTQMCKIEDEEAQCVDISCEIPLEFTTLNYDTFYLKSGEIGVIREDGSASRIHVDDNYVINLDNNEQVCVQYGGPGEVHHMYACDRGEVKDSSISLFKGRSRICEFNGTSGKLEIRENKYQECLECSSVDDSIGNNNLYKIYKWFAKLGDLAGWSAVDISYWDYWLFDPGLCNSVGACSDKGDCVYGDSNWCVPKYPVDSYSGCNSFTESKAGSPYNKPDEACQSCGNCKKYDKPIGVVGTGAICLANIVVGGFTDWLMEGMANALLSEDEVDQVKKEAEKTEEEPTEEEPTEEEVTEDSDEVATTGRVRSAYNTARSIVVSFKNDYLDEVVWPILKKVVTLGGVFSVSDFEDSARHYFNINYQPDTFYEGEESISYRYDPTTGNYYQVVDNGRDILLDSDEVSRLNLDSNNFISRGEWNNRENVEIEESSNQESSSESGEVKSNDEIDPNTGSLEYAEYTYELQDDGSYKREDGIIINVDWNGYYYDANGDGQRSSGEGMSIEFNELASGLTSSNTEISNDAESGTNPIPEKVREFTISLNENSKTFTTWEEFTELSIEHQAMFFKNNYDKFGDKIDMMGEIRRDAIIRYINLDSSDPIGAMEYLGSINDNAPVWGDNSPNGVISEIQNSPPKTFSLFKPIMFSRNAPDVGEIPEVTPYELQTYGNLHIPDYTGRQLNEIEIAEEWLKAWWDDGTVVLTMLWSRVKSAGTTIILTTVLKKIMGDLVLETLGWLNPQKWFRTVVCNTVTLGFPGVQQLCENKYFFAFASCAVMTLASQGTYNAGLCAPEDWRKVGYEDCHLCNDDEVNACTSSRCLGLGTDCVYESGICDASEDALERCDETLNDDMIITTDLSGVFEVNHSSPFHEFEFQTSKSSNCRYSKEPVNFDAMIRLTNLDRAGLNHRGNFWAGDNLLDDYKYYLQCSWACDEEDWGEEKSPLYELNIHRLPKPDEEAPIIIESYPYPAQLLESTNSVVMWVEADESLESCKYAELDFDSFQAETDALVADQTSGSEVSKEEGESAVDNLLLGLGLTNPSIPMERSADNKFQINIDGLENGESYAYSIVCEDYSALSTPSRPKIILFRVSNPFDVSIINPEHLSSTSRHIKEIKASSGSLETECKYSFEVKKQYSEMGIFDTTGSRAHTTQLVDPLRSGNYDLYVSCVNFDTLDLATGHSQFTIIPDVTAPRLARITGGNKLTIETDEYTNCTYSDEDFDAEQIPMTNSGDGANGFFIEHSLQTSDASSYYILCQDMDGNQGNFIIYP